MADFDTSRIAAAVPFVMPVLGGILGVVYVNLVPESQINPVLGIGLGAVAGTVVSRIILKLLHGRR